LVFRCESFSISVDHFDVSLQIPLAPVQTDDPILPSIPFVLVGATVVDDHTSTYTRVMAMSMVFPFCSWIRWHVIDAIPFSIRGFWASIGDVMFWLVDRPVGLCVHAHLIIL